MKHFTKAITAARGAFDFLQSKRLQSVQYMLCHVNSCVNTTQDAWSRIGVGSKSWLGS